MFPPTIFFFTDLLSASTIITVTLQTVCSNSCWEGEEAILTLRAGAQMDVVFAWAITPVLIAAQCSILCAIRITATFYQNIAKQM